MYNSIIDFIENDTTKIKKILEKYLFAGNTLRFEEDLMRVMIEFGRKIYQECLKEIEENIRQSEFRKKTTMSNTKRTGGHFLQHLETWKSKELIISLKMAGNLYICLTNM